MDKLGSHFYDNILKEHDHDGVYSPVIHSHPYVNKTGDTMTGNLLMGTHKVTGLADGSSNGQAVHFGQFSNTQSTTKGSVELPNGFTINWGETAEFESVSSPGVNLVEGASLTKSVVFDSPFSVVPKHITAQVKNGGYTGAGSHSGFDHVEHGLSITTSSTTGCTFRFTRHHGNWAPEILYGVHIVYVAFGY